MSELDNFISELKNAGFDIEKKKLRKSLTSLLMMSREEVGIISTNDKVPIVVSIIANELLSDNAYKCVSDLLDRIIGKAGIIENEKSETPAKITYFVETPIYKA